MTQPNHGKVYTFPTQKRFEPLRMPFRKVPPGETVFLSGRSLVKVDPNCDFASHLERPRSYAVSRDDGALTLIGPDTEVEMQSVEFSWVYVEAE